MLFDKYSVNQVNEAVEHIKSMIEDGTSKKKTKKGLCEEYRPSFLFFAIFQTQSGMWKGFLYTGTGERHRR